MLTITAKNHCNILTSRQISMKKQLKLIISSAMLTLTFISPQTIHGMEDFSNLTEQKKPSGIQLSKGEDDTLEAVLGAGNNVLLKIGVSLKDLQPPIVKEQIEVPVRLFLTDLMLRPTSYPAINFAIKIDCDSTTLTCTLPNKPESFENYSQFVGWLNQGYFTNQINITYDFSVDIHQSAPYLAQHLFAVPSDGYHFVGTYVVHNDKIMPDGCVPNVAYSPQRGNTNSTIVTLGGNLYLNNCSYPIEGHQQIFPYPMIEEIIFKKDVPMKRQDIENELVEAKQDIEDLKKQLESTQREADDLRRKVCDAKIAQSTAVEPEQQRIRQETEEKVALWCSGIDITIQHIKELQAYSKYEELLGILEMIKDYYTKKGQMGIIMRAHPNLVMWITNHYDILQINDPRELDEIAQGIEGIIERISQAKDGEWTITYYWRGQTLPRQWVRTGEEIQSGIIAIQKRMKGILIEKMEKFRELQGTVHPRRDELDAIM